MGLCISFPVANVPPGAVRSHPPAPLSTVYLREQAASQAVAAPDRSPLSTSTTTGTTLEAAPATSTALEPALGPAYGASQPVIVVGFRSCLFVPDESSMTIEPTPAGLLVPAPSTTTSFSQSDSTGSSGDSLVLSSHPGEGGEGTTSSLPRSSPLRPSASPRASPGHQPSPTYLQQQQLRRVSPRSPRSARAQVAPAIKSAALHAALHPYAVDAVTGLEISHTLMGPATHKPLPLRVRPAASSPAASSPGSHHAHPHHQQQQPRVLEPVGPGGGSPLHFHHPLVTMDAPSDSGQSRLSWLTAQRARHGGTSGEEKDGVWRHRLRNDAPSLAETRRMTAFDASQPGSHLRQDPTPTTTTATSPNATAVWVESDGHRTVGGAYDLPSSPSGGLGVGGGGSPSVRGPRTVTSYHTSASTAFTVSPPVVKPRFNLNFAVKGGKVTPSSKGLRQQGQQGQGGGWGWEGGAARGGGGGGGDDSQSTSFTHHHHYHIHNHHLLPSDSQSLEAVAALIGSRGEGVPPPPPFPPAASVGGKSSMYSSSSSSSPHTLSYSTRPYALALQEIGLIPSHLPANPPQPPPHYPHSDVVEGEGEGAVGVESQEEQVQQQEENGDIIHGIISQSIDTGSSPGGGGKSVSPLPSPTSASVSPLPSPSKSPTAASAAVAAATAATQQLQALVSSSPPSSPSASSSSPKKVSSPQSQGGRSPQSGRVEGGSTGRAAPSPSQQNGAGVEVPAAVEAASPAAPSSPRL